MKSFLYEIVFPNGKRYIGITRDTNRRLREHKARAACRGNTPLQNAIRKYNAENVVLTVLACGPTEYIKDLEISAISLFNTLAPRGYNGTIGGEGVSPSVMKNKKLPAEWVMNAAAGHRGCKVSAEGRRNISLGQQGRVCSLVTRQKMSAAHLGKKRPVEVTQKIVATRTGTKVSKAGRINMIAGQLRRWAKHRAEMEGIIK